VTPSTVVLPAGETFVAEEEEEEEEGEIETAGGKKKKKKAKRKDRKLVFDETLGKVVAVKERKSGRKDLWDQQEEI